MVYVIKIKYGDTLRRITFEKTGDVSFPTLENKIRTLFEIPAEKQIHVTYNDGDNDVITMADDQDLVDALVMQSLNPLRLQVASVEPESTPAAPARSEEPSPQRFEQSLNSWPPAGEVVQYLKGMTPENFKELLLKGAAASPRHLTDLTEVFNKVVLNQVAGKGPGFLSRQFAEAFARGSTQGGVASAAVDKPAENGSSPPPMRRSEFRCGTFEARTPSPVTKMQVPNLPAETADVKPVPRVFHTNVQCDVCGMTPIAGTRFKSTKRYDYDLCSNCFKDADDQADYNRIEQPLFRPRHLHPSGSGRMRCPAFADRNQINAARYASMSTPYCSRLGGRSGHTHLVNSAANGGKLDSRFVEDVTIKDGTEMAPGTRFTKVWRLRNSGKIPWGPHMKLVHVGGDELGSVLVVPLVLPENGLLPEQEVEVAVDLVAPEKPGRYVAHWRLASPAGPKFGHRVWVVIQVVVKENNPVGNENVVNVFSIAGTEGSETSANKSQVEATETTPLEIPTFYDSREAFVKASHESMEKIAYPKLDTAKHVVEEPREASAGRIAYPKLDMAKAFVDVLEPFSSLKIFGNEPAVETKEENPSVAVKSEMPAENVAHDEVVAVENSELGGGFSMVEMPSNGSNRVNSILISPTGEVEVFPGNKTVEDVNTPEYFSTKLEAMGFTDRELNVELLVKNKLDIRQTLDALFAASEWDPLLEELKEMGFQDEQMNRRLMFKNNGSVKRVVKELVQMYKKPADQEKGKGVIIE